MEQEAFLTRVQARLRELEALRDEAGTSLTADELAWVDQELLQRLDDVHGAITRVLRGQRPTLGDGQRERYTVYRLDLPAGRWLRVLTTRDLLAAVRHLIAEQGAGEIARFVGWLTLAERTAQEHDPDRFRPRLNVVDATGDDSGPDA